MNQQQKSISTVAEPPALARRIEEASLNAWPALQQIFLDGWILRFARGFTKRANSIVPLYESASANDRLAEKVRYCEGLYAQQKLQAVFRLTSFSENSEQTALDRLLAARGYKLRETSLVLTTKLEKAPAQASFSEGTAAPVELQMLSLDEWLTVYCQLTDMPEPASSLHAIILKGISGECGFGVLRADGQPVACGLAVVERELVGLFDIFTHPEHRGHGHAAFMVKGLLNWATNQGAERAYLQMVEDNVAATALYTALGFSCIYHYWYRIQD
jgi:GNAT superfamily N-acetyltransferase